MWPNFLQILHWGLDSFVQLLGGYDVDSQE